MDTNQLDTSVARKILSNLVDLNRNFVSKDYDYALEYLRGILPFEILEFAPKQSFHGWCIPPKWDFVMATISFEGKEIYRVTHPLEIIGLSKSFAGTVSREELREHLHFDHRYPDAVPYHFRQNYRPWDRTWGFCVPQSFYEALVEGDYEVDIITEESLGNLKVADYLLPGSEKEEIIFIAHLDHPGMANDDLAGVAVGVELFCRLRRLKERKFSYRLVLVQEMIGSEFYLHYEGQRVTHVVGACFLEMLGSETQLALQSSLKKNSGIEWFIKQALDGRGIDYRTGDFKEIICNDEVIWEAYRIPTASLSRFPYPEYHSSKDGMDIMSDRSLEESVVILEDAIGRMEGSELVIKNFEGTPCVSHPQYNLYIDPGQVAFGSLVGSEMKAWRKLMDTIPLLEHPIFIPQLAGELGLAIDKVSEYLRKWKDKQLVTLR